MKDLKHPFPRSTHLRLLHISCVIVVIEKHDPSLYFYIMDGSKRWGISTKARCVRGQAQGVELVQGVTSIGLTYIGKFSGMASGSKEE